MKNVIKNLLYVIKSKIRLCLLTDNKQIRTLLLKAYNRYQEDERDYADYIYNINDKDDLKCCIDGGLTAYDIVTIVGENPNAMFLFGANHDVPLVLSEQEIDDAILAHLDDMLPCMLAYHEVDGYRELYDYLIANYIIENMMQ